MTHSRTESVPTRIGTRRIWLFLGLLVIGTAGYFGLRGHWAFYLLAHVGAIGVLGLLGVAAGAIARAKGYDYGRAFWIGFLVPIILGLVAVFAVRWSGGSGTPFYCGGSVSLGVAILTLIGYSLLKRKRLEGPY